LQICEVLGQFFRGLVALPDLHKFASIVSYAVACYWPVALMYCLFKCWIIEDYTDPNKTRWWLTHRCPLGAPVRGGGGGVNHPPGRALANRQYVEQFWLRGLPYGLFHLSLVWGAFMAVSMLPLALVYGGAWAGLRDALAVAGFLSGVALGMAFALFYTFAFLMRAYICPA